MSTYNSPKNIWQATAKYNNVGSSTPRIINYQEYMWLRLEQNYVILYNKLDPEIKFDSKTKTLFVETNGEFGFGFNFKTCEVFGERYLVHADSTNQVKVLDYENKLEMIKVVDYNSNEIKNILVSWKDDVL